MVFGTILFAVPLGIGAGIYLAEYSRDNKFTRLVRIAINNLNGTPSIIFGLFGFTVFVLYFKLGFSLLAGQLTLALMVLPTIIRTTENAIRTVSIDLRDGSYALGATKWQTIRKVVLPAASPGIITGIILSMGRAAGKRRQLCLQQRFLWRDIYHHLNYSQLWLYRIFYIFSQHLFQAV